MSSAPSLRSSRHALPVSPGRLAAVLLIAALFSTEVLFQPEVLERYPAEAVVRSLTSRFLECAAAGTAIAIAVAFVERRPPRVAWRYTGAIVAAAIAGAALGTALWGAAVFGARVVELGGYLAGQSIRLCVGGAFLALADGFRHRRRVAREKAREFEAAHAALVAQTDLAQLRLLEAQIEPHFLFNTIANLRRVWRVDPALGEQMHRNLVRYLEATLPATPSPFSSLGEEIELARAYLELCGIRMGARLGFAIELPPALAAHAFPRMMLLTLVENAIKHGLAPADDGGRIEIRARLEDDTLVVGVVDDGVGFGVAATGGTGIGLANIRSRLRTRYGRSARLEVASGPQGGVAATIRLPIEPLPRSTSADSRGTPGRVGPDLGVTMAAAA